MSAILAPPAWARRGACADPDVDPEAFFPAHGERANAARRVCRRCPLKTRCLEYAMAREQGQHRSARYGVWGGASPKQRAQLELCRSGQCGHPSRVECVRGWPR